MATLSRIDLIILTWINQSVAEVTQALMNLKEYAQDHTPAGEREGPDYINSQLDAILIEVQDLNKVVYELIERASQDK